MTPARPPPYPRGVYESIAIIAKRVLFVNAVAFIVLLLILLACSAWLAASETALFSLDRLAIRELERRADAASRRVLLLLERPNRLLVTLLLGSTLVNIGASAVATALLVRIYPHAGIWLSFLIMTALILLVGEIVPKSLALSYPLAWSRTSAPALAIIGVVLSPVVTVASRLADALVYRRKEAVRPPSGRITRDEVLSLVEEVREQGALSPEETRLARRVVDFSAAELVEVMTPWVDVIRVSRDAPRKDVEALLRTSRHSRFPVHGADEDDVVGYLTAKSYLANPESTIEAHLRPLLVLPEMQPAAGALRQMAARHRQMSLVVNEHGRPVGIVTVEDLVEEIVGEIYDEFDAATELVVPVAPGRFRLAGRAPIDLVTERTGLRLDAGGGEFVTLNGFISDLVGEIPSAGDRIHWNGSIFEILGVERNRITWCLLTLPAGHDVA